MDAIGYALKEIRAKIPLQILSQGLKLKEDIDEEGFSLDGKIVHRIIKEEVMMRTKMLDGIEMLIPLNTVKPRFDRYRNAVFTIPKEMTLGRDIIAVRGVSTVPLDGNNGYVGDMSFLANYGLGTNINSCERGTEVGRAAAKVYNSHRSAPIDYNHRTSLIGPNMIKVQALQNFYTVNLAVNVLVEQDGEMNHLQPASYIHFAKLCVMKAKAILYNNLIIEIDMGKLDGGQELGAFARILESYETADEEFDMFLNDQWKRVAFLNNQQRTNRLIKSMMHGGY